MNKQEFDFTLLADYSGDYEAVEKAVIEAGCDDAVMGLSHGCIILDFSREAETLIDAIFSAMNDVAKAGLCVRRVDSCGLVTQADIASRIGRTRQLVNQYIQGTRGPGGFPPPDCYLDDDHAPLWSWCEVARWLFENQLIEREKLQEALILDIINNSLDLRRHQSKERELTQQVSKSLEAWRCGCEG
jgi:hypothetical protein